MLPLEFWFKRVVLVCSLVDFVLHLALLAVLVGLDYDLHVLRALGVVRLLVAFDHLVASCVILLFCLLVRCRAIHIISFVLRIFLVYLFVVDYVLPFWPLTLRRLLPRLLLLGLGGLRALLAFLS